jgi:hypothetical protein
MPRPCGTKISEKVSYLCEIRAKEGHKKNKIWSITKPVQVFKERPIMLHKTQPMNLKQQNQKSKKHRHGTDRQ